MAGRSAYHKKNISWPVRWGGSRFASATLVDRAENALRHLLVTPLNSLWWHPDYGTRFYEMRTQGMNIDLVNIAEAHLRQAVGKFIPDINIINVSVDVQDEDQKLKIACAWVLKNATARMHGDLAKPRESQVLV